jgi:5-methylthioadenosine/S-adenosylhomocysteine deaminase
VTAADLVIDDVIAMVPAATGGIDFLPGARIVVAGGSIVSVGPADGPAPAAREVLDGRGQIAMPGLVNAHTHAPMVLFRGAAEDVSTEDWFNKRIWPMEVNLTADDVELGARLACAEMIAAGVTTFADHYFHADRVANAVADTGIRANLGWTYFSSEGTAGRDRGLEFALSHRDAAGGRITTCLAPHGVYTVSDDDLRATGEAGREHDLLVHIHCAENRAQTRASRVQRGITPVAVLHDTGVLEGRTLIAHGKGIVAEDVPYLLRAAGRVGVGVSPKGYLKVAEEITPIRLMLAAGVAVGMATDGAASNNTLDVWESMMITALVQKYRERDELWLSARQALELATSGGAAAVGLAEEIGSLAVGRRADVILVDLSGPHTQPIHDLAATLVFSARSADVSTTIVDGRVLMRDRRLLTVDVGELSAALAPRLAELTDVSHGSTIQSYQAM